MQEVRCKTRPQTTATAPSHAISRRDLGQLEAFRLQGKHACALNGNSHECSECAPVGSRAPQTCMPLYAEAEADLEVHADLRTHVRQTHTCRHMHARQLRGKHSSPRASTYMHIPPQIISKFVAKASQPLEFTTKRLEV
jgi:hypothetical protein